MRRILLVLSVAALMAVMLVAMAMPAFAIPPADRPPETEANPPLGPPAAGGDTARDCDGGKTNANHALNLSSPSWDASAIDNPSRNGDANRAEGAGLDNALESLEIVDCPS